MTKSHIIGVYSDEYASSMSSQAREIRELRHYLKQIDPDAHILEIDPRDLGKHHNLDCYLFDFGGYCYVDYSGSMREAISKNILQFVEMYPNTLFVPVSSMTSRFFVDVMPDEMKNACSNVNTEYGYSLMDVMPKIYEWLFGKKFVGELDYFDEPFFIEEDEEDDTDCCD